MASVSSPYGLQAISSQVGVAVRPHRIPFGIASGLASNIFKGTPVKLNPATGTIVPCTNPGGTPDQVFGIFMGVDYTPSGGRPAVSPFWPTGTVYVTTEDMLVYIYPLWQPATRIKVQADGAVAQALLGCEFNFTNLTAGNTQTGLSACTVGAAGVPLGSQGQLTLVEFATDINDTIGDAFTDLICTVAYPQVGFRGQNSIG